MTNRKYETYGTGEFDLQLVSISRLGKGDTMMHEGTRYTLAQDPQLTHTGLAYEVHTEGCDFPLHFSRGSRVKKVLPGNAKEQALLMALKSHLTQDIRKVMNTRGLSAFSMPAAIADMLISKYNVGEK